MNIVKRNVELVSKQPYEEMLKENELAIRNCYRSEDKITDDSAERMVRMMIKSGHGAVIEFANVTFHIVADRALLSQLSRHRLMSLAVESQRYCLTGDTIVQSYSKTHKNGGKKRTIKKLYDYYTNNMSAFKKINLRSVDDTNTVIPNKPISVFYNGKKDVYMVITESGRSIKATLGHEFLTKDGYKKLSELSIGDYIGANGIECLDNEDWLRYNYLDLNRTREDIANQLGCCESVVYKAFKKFNIVKQKSMYPNRKPGHSYKGCFTKDALKRMSEAKSGKNNPCWKSDDELTKGGAYARANREYSKMKDKCDICGSTVSLEIHRKDKNPKNNSKDNIMVLCSDCHHLWHRTGHVGVFYDKIISIEYSGIEDVYDIEMSGETHNYVANGLVVHNCNYSKNKFNNSVNFIIPCNLKNYDKWEAFCSEAEETYFDMIEHGDKAEVARSVLPNCVATSIYVRMNMRELRHFLELRLSNHAQADIRDIANQMYNLVREHYPVYVENLIVDGVKFD